MHYLKATLAIHSLSDFCSDIKPIEGQTKPKPTHEFIHQDFYKEL